MRFELTTPTLARLCSTPELRPLGGKDGQAGPLQRRTIAAVFRFASVGWHKKIRFYTGAWPGLGLGIAGRLGAVARLGRV